jgi:DNA-binding XRE family transcriptional regulator
MTEQAKGERQTFAECPYCGRSLPEPVFSAHLGLAHQLTPPPAPEPAICPSCQEIRCDPDCDNPRAAKRPAPGPAKGGEARVEYAEGMMYPWRVIQGLEEDGETPNCVASLREKSVAEFVTGLINERAQLRAANEALREREQHLGGEGGQDRPVVARAGLCVHQSGPGARMRLGEMLRLWRTVRNLDQRTVAKEIGISAATLCRAEQGRSFDATSMAKVIAWLISDDKLTGGANE